MIPSGSSAVHDLGLLELDTTAPQYANTADDSAPVNGSNAPYDWESIFNSSGQQILTSATEPRLLLAEFNPDYVTPDESYFATSNKDIDNVSTWQCGSINNPTPKDEIANAYSALFLNTQNNHVIFYAGAERDANNGNSFMGFWIFKSGVGCSSPGTFSGQHTDGDILVLSNFTGGGNHPLVEVYEWSNGGLTLIDSGNFCHASNAGDDVCGEVNGLPFQTTWAPHSDAANPLNTNEFLEVGVDLTNALSFPTSTVPCFARFLAETRSSQETTATLKDFAGGQFNTCASSTVTTPRAGGASISGSTVIPGTSVTDRAVVTGSALVGTPEPPTGSVSFFLCGPQPTQAAAQCTSGGTQVGSAVNLPAGSANPKTVDSAAVAPTDVGWYCFRAEYSGDTNYADGSSDSSLNECFQVAKVNPTVSTDIHNAAHNIVTVVEAGSTVHDLVSVTGGSGTPSGDVTVDWFTNNTCAGSPASTSASLTLDGSGQVDATSFAKGPLDAGLYGFQAHYGGSTVYNSGTGPCEPLRVVDANISITPETATNRIGATHTFTAHVNINDGTGSTSAPDGTSVSFVINSGPGVFTSANPCTTSGGTGSCTITLQSNVTGVTSVSASTTVSVFGISLNRSTDGQGSNSGPAQKTWVDAKISIAPSATNEVGQPHTFTVTLMKDLGDGNGFVAAQGERVDVTLTDALGASHSAPTGSCTNAGANTDANGQCTITFTSSSTGAVTGHASSTLTLAGLLVTVSTDGNAPNSADAVKTFVDAKISIAPSATNRVGDPHTFTVTLWKDLGDGNGFVKAEGEHVDVTLTDASGASHSAPTGSCTNAGANTDAQGQCTITFASNDTGTVTGHASSTLTLAGLQVTVSTDGNPPNSADAVKTYVDAKISIAPSATNEVGQPHTFTVTLWKDLGDGNGFVKAEDEHVTVTLTDANGASHSAPTGTCAKAGANTDSSGQCTITFTSSSTGTVTAHAAATLTLGSPSTAFTVETDGTAGNSGDATKTFVDANIQITPQQATNPLNTQHVLTGHVNVDDGSGGGFVNAPDGTAIDFQIVSGPGSFVGPSSCNTSGGTGSCTVTITSATTGTTIIRASTDVTVGGIVLHRESGDGKAGDSGDASKIWASAKIAIAPSATNAVGQSHTFTVTLMKDSGAGFVPAQGEHVDVTLTDGNLASHSAPTGTCTNAGANTDSNGQCTITFTSNTAGTVTGHASATLDVSGTTITVETDGLAENSGNAVKTFVDANIQITPAAANNPVGTNHTLSGHVNINPGTGFVNAPDGTLITFTLSGPGSFVGPSSCTTSGGTGSCSVVISSTVSGASSIKASTDVTVGGVTLHRETGDAKPGDSASASKLWADDSARTDILDASGGVVTTVVSGTVVHDKVFVARSAGTPAVVPDPTGSVVFHRYATLDCTGAATNQSVVLTAGSPSTAVSDDFAPTGSISYQAEYLGDANYPARTGDCEPLTVTPAPAPAIAIVKNPKSQTVAVGGTARFTITVTNAGNTVLTDVHVDDPLSPNCSRSKAEIPELASMAPGATVTYSCSRPNVRASFDNVATATGTPPSGPNVTASDTAPVKAKALTPAKKKVKKKKKPKVVSHKKPKATG